MDDWRSLDTPPARLKWARRHADFSTATEAAAALQIEAPTYRSYEREPADGGRWPRSAQIQRIGKRFRVSWVWIETGDGAPFIDAEAAEAAEEAAQLANKVQRLPIEKRRDAVNAAMSVLDSFIKTGKERA